jgi:hypothetical protein
MKTHKKFRLWQKLTLGLLAFLFFGCERDINDLSSVSHPDDPEVFIDGFSAGLNYAAFGGSVPTAFDVDQDITWNNSRASMRFEVPNAGDPRGAYAGGAFFTESGRNLSKYNALTFWAKASQSATLDVAGLGNDLGASTYQVTVSGLQLSTGWNKYFIPIPDPSKLTAERGMFFYSVGPDNGQGFTIWIDEVKFEHIGTIAHPQHAMLLGQDQIETAFTGVSKSVAGLTSVFNMPTGINQSVQASPAYFSFASSDETIATVDAMGNVTVVGGPGDAVITAQVGDIQAQGSLTIQSIGDFQLPPQPVHEPERVISVFSDSYNSVPVDYYNGYWAPWQTTLSADFEVEGNHILHYTDFNFVGIQMSSPFVNASSMTHLHVDLYLPNALAANAQFRIELVDNAGGGTGLFSTNIAADQAQQWIRLDIPLANFAGLSGKTTLWQIIFVDVAENIPSFYADNIYFFNDGSQQPPQPSAPATAAPVPTAAAANVTSIYGENYPPVDGTDFFPDWGQATVVSEVQIQGNKTLKYTGLNYQGIQLGSSQNVSDMDYLHIDYWTANSSILNVYLISPGPVETAYALPVPTSGWSGIDIPLSAFDPVNLNDVIQLKFDGDGDIYLDNIYFFRD